MSTKLLAEDLRQPVSPNPIFANILNIICLVVMENLKLEWLLSSQEIRKDHFCAVTGNEQTLHTDVPQHREKKKLPLFNS